MYYICASDIPVVHKPSDHTIYSTVSACVLALHSLNQTTTQFSNAVGQKVRVTDPNGKSLLYTYDTRGNLDTVTGATGSVVNMDYDKLGRKIAMRDPDMGNWRYGHNHFGELTSQNDGKNQVTTMSYDGLGRMTSRVSNSDSSTWVYDLAVAGKGLLFQEYNYIDGANPA